MRRMQISIYIQYFSRYLYTSIPPHPALMAEDTDKKTATWTLADDTTLVHTLADQKIAGNWGDNNPKPKAWTECEKKLEGSEICSGGLPKIGNILRNRWQKVRGGISHIFMTLIYASVSLRKIMVLSRKFGMLLGLGGTPSSILSQQSPMYGLIISR